MVDEMPRADQFSSGTVLGRLRRFIITVIAVLMLAVGFVLLVLPGPGLIVLLLGVALLSIEYPWAKRLIDWLRKGKRQRNNGG